MIENKARYLVRLPRAGGDPERFTPADCGPLESRFRGERAEGRVDDPLTPPSPPEGGEGLSVLALSLWERVG